jgi:ferritin
MEQVEEEKSAREIVRKFHLVRNDPASMLDLDRELGSRTTAAQAGAQGRTA